jgi:hypothetical protein
MLAVFALPYVSQCSKELRRWGSRRSCASSSCMTWRLASASWHSVSSHPAQSHRLPSPPISSHRLPSPPISSHRVMHVAGELSEEHEAAELADHPNCEPWRASVDLVPHDDRTSPSLAPPPSRCAHWGPLEHGLAGHPRRAAPHLVAPHAALRPGSPAPITGDGPCPHSAYARRPPCPSPRRVVSRRPQPKP